MKLIVTGSSGKFGQHVVRNLTGAGHDVLGIDRVANPSLRPSWVCDLSRTGDLFEAFAGAEAVVHLAAISAPNLAPESVTFDNNVIATYNVEGKKSCRRLEHCRLWLPIRTETDSAEILTLG